MPFKKSSFERKKKIYYPSAVRNKFSSISQMPCNYLKQESSNQVRSYCFNIKTFKDKHKLQHLKICLFVFVSCISFKRFLIESLHSTTLVFRDIFGIFHLKMFFNQMKRGFTNSLEQTVCPFNFQVLIPADNLCFKLKWVE